MRYFQLRTESVLKSTSDLCTEKNPTCRATIFAATSRGYQYVCLSGPNAGTLSRPVSVQRSLVASQVTCRNFPTSDHAQIRQNCPFRPENQKKKLSDKKTDRKFSL